MKEVLFNTKLFLILRCDNSMYEKSCNNNKVYILGLISEHGKRSNNFFSRALIH